ncbi:ATP-binding cassette domain-containing protein [Bdellovibrio sp. HCB337]|uniref:ABC transporter ATP-binding protein n=1 Tax=Bdellovibrio sp. HCB337 TaxID=3394358 RepID=UPI0039A5A4E5
MSSAVQVKNLVVQFGDFKAVNNITFEVPRGEVFGFLGANGAGKTTTIRVLCGLLVPKQGEVAVAGIPLTDANSIDRIKSKVGYMSQKFTLYDDMTVEENLSFIASLRKIPKDLFETRKNELFDFVSFHKKTDTTVRDLPGGMKQQMALVGSLLHDPEIIFLDEPTAGVTSAVRAKFWSLIKELAKKNKTVFVTSHYMDEVEQCDRIALMRTGELIALDSPAQLKKQVFPDPLYELKTSENIPYSKVEEIKRSGLFESFEPHGLQYHALPKDRASWQKFLQQDGKLFSYQEIAPTLEDVFIRLVEGKTR